MTDFTSVCALAAIASALLLPIAKREKELASVISALLYLSVFAYAALRLGELIGVLQSSLGIAEGTSHIDVLLKIAGVSLLTSAAATLCEENGQRAAARAVELLGAVETVLCAKPILDDLFSLAERTFLR